MYILEVDGKCFRRKPSSRDLGKGIDDPKNKTKTKHGNSNRSSFDSMEVGPDGNSFDHTIYNITRDVNNVFY